MDPIRTFLREFEWIHTGIGIFGNLSFAVGSVLFLSEATMRAGVWFFVVGSFGMLIGSVGSALIKLERDGGPRARGGPERPT